MKKLGSIILAFAVCISLSVPAFATDVSFEKVNNEDFSRQSLVYEYAEAISSKDVDRYINLFTDENRRNMHEYLDEFGETDFFHEENVEILNIAELSTDTAELSAGLSPSEISDYENIVVLYAEIHVNDGQKEYKTFILVNEYDEWKILRISTPNLQLIVEANEGFGTKSEREQLNEQEDLKVALLEGTLISVATPDADPIEITVYFKQQANKDHYGVPRKTLEWNTYLKNVIPKEWIVSYYDYYPEYLRAGTMASKMYAWWYIVYPKWNYSPYYANVWDNTEDQTFLYSAYDDLEFDMYRDDVNEVMSWVKNIAMCNNEGNLFEVHYNKTNGTQHSGVLNQDEALELAMEGKSTYQILAYYYNNSPYIGENHTIQFYGYV